MVRTGFCIVALLLLALPSCRSVEQYDVKASSGEFYHIFVREFVDGEDTVVAILEIEGDSIEEPPEGYEEVTVEQLHEMGCKTAEEALADALVSGFADTGSVTMPDATHREYGCWLDLEVDETQKKYDAGTYTKTDYLAMKVFVEYYFRIECQGQTIHEWGPTLKSKWNYVAFHHRGRWNLNHVHDFYIHGNHWWNSTMGAPLESEQGGSL